MVWEPRIRSERIPEAVRFWRDVGESESGPESSLVVSESVLAGRGAESE